LTKQTKYTNAVLIVFGKPLLPVTKIGEYCWML